MAPNYIELRSRNSFGDIINTYFNFLKYNFKHYTSLYLRYNAISIILALVAAYLLVTGFMGLASRDFRFGMGGAINNNAYLIGGVAMLFLIVFATTLINYSFSSSYVVSYAENKGEVESRDVWIRIRENLGTIMIFIMLGIAIYIGYIITSFILALIPVIGMFAQYGISFLISSIFGLSFMSIFFQDKSLGNSLTEGWEFTFSNFWKVVLYGLVIGILNLMITALILSIPTFIISIYVYFSVQSEVEIVSSVFASIVFTLGLAMFLIAFIYSQALTQIAYGVLYYNLHEERYNTYLRQKIEQIGVNE
ncbi:hypothetical protein SAMN03097699_1449 [Flavobacteriaceae bacterium MAR_2010_188]|nr:hypothetical protein SAMN03097699_1449 [Flavobacteriaceae bacterium MAR_2010_188]